MFSIIRLAMQLFLKPYSLQDRASCKKFIENLLAVVRPAAAMNNIAIDDKILRHLEYILKNEMLFDYFYTTIINQFQTKEVVFESVDEKIVNEMIENGAAKEEYPQAVNPFLIITLISQAVSLINALKKM